MTQTRPHLDDLPPLVVDVEDWTPPLRTPHRPAPPARRGIAVRLRQLAGVDESILDWVPEERPRYTRLGFIILNTGLLAGLSLMAGLRKVVDVPWPAVVPVAAVWAFLVICFDSWLIASTHGALNRSRLLVFLPRVLITLLMGAFIAEPLVLWFFQPSVTKEVRDHRQDQLTAYESALTRCNPLPGQPAADGAECAGLSLNIPTVEDQRAKLARLIEQQNLEQAQVNTLNDDLRKKEENTRLECNGTPGRGLSGRFGEGPNCLRLQREGAAIRASLADHQRALGALNTDVRTATTDVASAEATYAQAVADGIQEKVQQRKAAEGQIGLLDEVAALERLARASLFVLAASVLVRLLLIAVDMLPVFAKIVGGKTGYDEAYSRQLAMDQRLHAKAAQLMERRDTAATEVALHRTEHATRTRIGLIDGADQAARADREVNEEAEINALAARLRREADDVDSRA